MLETFPEAGSYVLWNDDKGRFHNAQESWLAKSPLRHSKHFALPFMLPTWRHIRPPQKIDWILISTHLFAHHARVRTRGITIPKLVYTHTPARYIWEPDIDKRGASLPARLASIGLRPLDRRRSQEATEIAANSEFTRKRIQDTWRQDARVIYPPVETERIIAGGDWAARVTGIEQSVLESLPPEFLLGASRFVPYKRLDLVIEAGAATGLPVVLAGSGPQRADLVERAKYAKVPVAIVDAPSDALLYALFQRAVTYVFPAIEDFGIMPVEAMAAGTPAIVPSSGGAAESVKLLNGGATVDCFTPAAWQAAVSTAVQIDRRLLPQRAQALSRTRFRTQVEEWVGEHIRSDWS